MTGDERRPLSGADHDGAANANVTAMCTSDVAAAVTALYSALGHELGNSLHPLRTALDATLRTLREAGLSPAEAPSVWDGVDRLEECLGAALGALARMASLARADADASQPGQLAPLDLGERALAMIASRDGSSDVEFVPQPVPAVLARRPVVDGLIATLLQFATTVAGAREGGVRVSLSSDDVQSQLSIAFFATEAEAAELRAALDPFSAARPQGTTDRHVTLYVLRAMAGRMNGAIAIDQKGDGDIAFRLSFVRADVLTTG